jgi:hypothetical protein
MKKNHRKRFPHNSKIPKVEVFQQITTFAVKIQEKTDIQNRKGVVQSEFTIISTNFKITD